MEDETRIEVKGDTLFVSIAGKLNTMRAMDLDEELSGLADDTVNICFDLEGLTYIASAGLRILYWAQEITEEAGGTLVVKHVSPEVYEIFEMTNFSDIIDIEKG